MNKITLLDVYCRLNKILTSTESMFYTRDYKYVNLKSEINKFLDELRPKVYELEKEK